MTGHERRLAWDWYDGTLPLNVELDESAYFETTFSFFLYRSRRQPGVRMGSGASAYLGTMFDVGPDGHVALGQYTLVHGAWFICDQAIDVGDYAMISWNVVLMDSYRWPREAALRRALLERTPPALHHRAGSNLSGSPIRIGSNVWIGFDVCVLPGVTIGEGAIVGARSVVFDDVPPYTIVAGNPAQVVREIPAERPTS